MPRNTFDFRLKPVKINPMGFGPSHVKKKRKTLTPSQRTYFWEHPKLCSKICSICHEKITKASDLELDHTRAYSKGGTKLAFAHRACNRIKGSGSLGRAQKLLGIKTKKRKATKKSTKRKHTNPFRIQSIKMPKFGF